MLYDFFYIEMFFGKSESPQKLETLIARYGENAVIKNISQGYLHMSHVSCQQEKSTIFCWLSDSGRDHVSKIL